MARKPADDYSEKVLNSLKETLLKEDDEVIYAARAMNYGEFHRLLYLAYPWLRSLEKRVKTARQREPVNMNDWSLKAPTFDKACFKCQISRVPCEAKAIGVPIGSPEGRRKYKGLGCKYCVASRSVTYCDALMDYWGCSPYPSQSTSETPVRKRKRRMEEEIQEETRSAQRIRSRPEVSFANDSSIDGSGPSTTFSLSQHNKFPRNDRAPSSAAAVDKSLDKIRAGYHSLAGEMVEECMKLATQFASMKRDFSHLKDENEKIQRELERIKESEAAARDECREMEKSFSTMKGMAAKAEAGLANLEDPMKELFSRMGRS